MWTEIEKHFENEAFRKRWRHQNHVISLTKFSSDMKQKSKMTGNIVAFLKFLCHALEGKHFTPFQSEISFSKSGVVSTRPKILKNTSPAWPITYSSPGFIADDSYKISNSPLFRTQTHAFPWKSSPLFLSSLISAIWHWFLFPLAWNQHTPFISHFSGRAMTSENVRTWLEN